ncbi:major facilitator superfamily protein [Whalleya microplaca]|nr:major facilitator superfamily protein [Whalleya microplaca]
MGSTTEVQLADHKRPREYPNAWKLIFLTIGICLTIFSFHLSDSSIIATAIPKTTSQLHSLHGVGSAICGAATNSVAFIFGRAVAGCGNAGLLSGALLILTHSVPLHRRSLFTAMMGSTYGVAAIPSGDPSCVPSAYTSETVFGLIKPLYPLGTLAFMSAFACVHLALQRGGTKYPWNSGNIIALFVVFGVLIIAFSLVQWWAQANAIVPPHIIKKRTTWSCTILTSVGAGLLTLFNPATTTAEWIGYQALQPLVAIQTVLGMKDVPTGTAVLSFAQSIGGSLVPDLNPSIVLDDGASNLSGLVPAQDVSAAMLSYGNRLTNVFLVGTVLVVLSAVGSVFVEWNSVKDHKIEAVIAA